MRIHKKTALAAAGAVALLVAGCAFFVWERVLDEPGPQGSPTPPPEGPAWIDLLDAEHAAGWENVSDDKDIFAVEDGQLHIEGHYPLRYVAYTPRTFSDFELHLEFRLAKGANSGIFLRSSPNDPVYRGFEVQVLEDYGEPPDKNGCGAIYDVVTPMFNMSRPPGMWNSFDIRVEGQEIEVVMNGWRVVLADFSKMTEPIGKFDIPYAELPLQGHLMLQDHGGEVWYRNIRIKPLQSAASSS